MSPIAIYYEFMNKQAIDCPTNQRTIVNLVVGNNFNFMSVCKNRLQCSHY